MIFTAAGTPSTADWERYYADRETRRRRIPVGLSGPCLAKAELGKRALRFVCEEHLVLAFARSEALELLEFKDDRGPTA